MWLKSNLLEDLITNLSAHPNPLELSINGTSLSFWRVSAKITIQQPLSDWVVRQNSLPKIYFRYGYNGDSHIALGSLFQVEEFPQITIIKNPYGCNPKLYGGVGNMHMPAQHSIWKNFPRTLFILPQIEIETVRGESFIHLHFLNNAELHKSVIIERLSQLQGFKAKENFITPVQVRREDFPTRINWDRSVEDLLENISLGRLEKVVLARQSSFTYKEPLSISYLMHLMQKIQRGTLFSIQFSSIENFIGVTPELLYSRKENNIEIMALAGTASLLQSQHLQRKKEQKEFGLVKEFVYEKMKTLCTTIDSSPDITYQIGSILHLCRNYRGKLLPFINDNNILTTLHPTPAISGFPQQLAARFLQKTEPFHRGWYAAPIGYVSEKESRMYIAIRSAFVIENILHLFSGAGVVKGSIAQKEWEELDKKIAQFFDTSTIT